VLIIVDDILVYSTNLQEHVIQVRKIFNILRVNQLYAKWSKCKIGVSEVDYLGHIISANGVYVDQRKIQAVMDWPTPDNLKALRSHWV